jgi:hypothetical protein
LLDVTISNHDPSAMLPPETVNDLAIGPRHERDVLEQLRIPHPVRDDAIKGLLGVLLGLVERVAELPRLRVAS